MPQRLRESSGRRAFAAIPIDAPDLPEDVVTLVDAHLLDLGGTYGDRRSERGRSRSRRRATWRAAVIMASEPGSRA